MSTPKRGLLPSFVPGSYVYDLHGRAWQNENSALCENLTIAIKTRNASWYPML